MKIIIGLGNPGKQYDNTRHNLGFQFLDFLKKTWNFPEFENNSKFKALLSKRGDVLLLKPQTFMNLSGETVQAVLDFYKLSPQDILVIHDDLDIEAGKYKITQDSSSAGHNGVKNIIEKIGSQNFSRVRVGVKNETLKNPIDAADFVLQEFEKEEWQEIKDLFPEIEKEIK